MFIEEVDLFQGMAPGFMNELSEMAREEFWEAGETIFSQGEVADTLYILESGRVNLVVQQEGSINFLLDHSGEVFGWSALVEPNTYTASARCYDDCLALTLDREGLEHVFQKHPQEAYTVMRRLAGVVGRRLMASYEVILQSRSRAATPSYG